MSEILEVYNLNSKLIALEERKKFYSDTFTEYTKTGKISKKVKTIRLILMNSSGRIYLQKRSKTKSDNAGLYDKTVGGHVSARESFTMTVIRECAEELGFPATVLEPEEFSRALKVTRLDIIGLFRKIDYLPDFMSKRIKTHASEYIQPFMTSIYYGYYDGPIRFIDGESSGIEVFSLEELKEDIQNNPHKFTEDIKFMIEKYENFLVPAY
jgi:isopentenyldiphosphate isomerase